MSTSEVSSASVTNISDESQTLKHDYTEHVITGIMPAREVHLFGGPSGGGKTTVLIALVEALSKGEKIFGHASHPTPFVYISSDRSITDMHRTADRLGIDWKAFPIFIPSRQMENVTDVIIAALKKFPASKLVVIEGFSGFTPNGKTQDYHLVAHWLRSLQELCEAKDITLIGVVHSPKCKPDEKYESPRERIMGSVAWGAYSNTIFYVEPMILEGIGKVRSFFILPRNAPEEKFQLDWKDGLLVQVKSTTIADLNLPIRSNYRIFLEWFDTIAIGASFTHAEACEATHLPDSSMRLECKKMTDQKRIVPYKDRPRGTFLKLAPGPEITSPEPVTGKADDDSLVTSHLVDPAEETS
jgi:hypothetical protein